MAVRHTLPFAVAAALLCGCDPAVDSSKMVGQKAPDFEVQTLQSSALTTSLAKLKGKPVIIDYWATWCGPCRQLSPHVEEIYAEFKGKGLQGMAISDEARDTVQKFESQNPHAMPVYIDQNDIANLAFKVKGLPTVVIIDKSGNVLYQEEGYPGGQIDIAVAAMRSAVEKACSSS